MPDSGPAATVEERLEVVRRVLHSDRQGVNGLIYVGSQEAESCRTALDSLGVDLSRLQQERDALVDALTRYPLTWHVRSEAEQQSFANVMEATKLAIKLRAAGLGEATE